MNILDELSELEHDQWAGWTKYMLDNLTPENIARWRRQIDTPYRKLSDKEKDSDRYWAIKVIMILEADGAYLAPDENGKLVKRYFKLSEKSKKQLKNIEERLFRHLTPDERELLKMIRC